MSDLLRSLIVDLDAETDQLRETVEASARTAGPGPPRRRAGPSPPRSRTCSGPTRWRCSPRTPRRGDEDKKAWDDVVLAGDRRPDGVRRRRCARRGRAAARRGARPLVREAGRRSARRSSAIPPGSGCRGSARRCHRRRWPRRGSWRPGRTPSTCTTPPAAAPDRPTGSGTWPTSACAPATTRTRSTDEEPPAEEFLVQLTAPSGETWSWGPDDAAADGHRVGVRLLPAGHPARPPRRHRPGGHRRRRRALALDRPGVRRTARAQGGPRR